MNFKSFLSDYEKGFVEFCTENNLEMTYENLSVYEENFLRKLAMPLLAAGAMAAAPQDAEAQGFKSAGGGVVPGVSAVQTTPKMQFSPVRTATNDPIKALQSYQKQNSHVKDGYLGNLYVRSIGQDQTSMVFDAQGKSRGRYVTHDKALEIFKKAKEAGWTYTGNYSFKSPDGDEVLVGNVRPSTFN